jgi:hypothetical protein
MFHIDLGGRETGLREITVFWDFSSSGILENRKNDVSETGSVSVLR